MVKTYVADTNFILSSPEMLTNYDVVIPSVVLREIENLERRKGDTKLQYQVRMAKRIINDLESVGKLKLDSDDTKTGDEIDAKLDSSYADNIILTFAIKNDYGLLTNDILLKFKALAYGLTVESGTLKEDVNDYKGFKVVNLNEEDYKELFLNLDVNTYEVLTNQYLVLNDETGKFKELVKWTGEHYQVIVNGLTKGFKTNQFKTKITPRDPYQKMAIDSIEHNGVTVIKGKAGSGKTLLSLHTAWHLVEKEGYRLVIFTNPVPALDAQELGFRKGETFDKLMQSPFGSMLKSKFGSVDEILYQINVNKKLEILPVSDIRGYDTGDDRTILYIPEAQNLTVYLMKLSLQRVAENCKVIVDGDVDQVDKSVYSYDNGMRRLSEIFRGSDLYGEVELQTIYRSKIANLADKL